MGTDGRGNYVARFPAGFLGQGWTRRLRAAMLTGVEALRCVGLVMSEKSAIDVEPVSFGERLATSPVFASLFRDGMALVEETASYLDGPGRQESKQLPRTASLVYATESMRLTTRLMQLASWLLLHRAVKEGEMSLAQASKEKTKVRLATADRGDPQAIALLPERLQDLIARSKKLQADVMRLDATIHSQASMRSWSNPVERQLGLLKAAFEQSRV